MSHPNAYPGKVFLEPEGDMPFETVPTVVPTPKREGIATVTSDTEEAVANAAEASTDGDLRLAQLPQAEEMLETRDELTRLTGPGL